MRILFTSPCRRLRRDGLPLAWRIESANHGDALFALPLFDAVRKRGFTPETCAMDKGYDSRAIHDGCEDRGCRPVVAQIRQQKARTHNDVPICEHGRWTSPEPTSSEGDQVALPERRVPAQVSVAQG